MRSNVYVRKYETKKKEKRYYLVVREPGRKDHHIQLGVVSKKVAEDRRVMVLNELLNGTYQRVSGVSPFFNEFCDKFLEEYIAGSKAPSTVKHYTWHLSKAKQAFGKFRLEQIQRKDIERYISALPIANRTKNITLTVLRTMFQKAVDWRYLASSPASEIRRWRQDCQGSQSLTPKDLIKILQSATPWEKSVIKVMVYTGMRPGELSQLKFKDIDWENQILKIVSDKERKTKNRKSRLVPLSPDLEKELKLLKEYLPNMFYKDGSKVSLKYLLRTEDQKEYVFCHRNGKPILCFRQCIRFALARAGIKGVTAHGLRKSFCSLLARQGVHPKVAQRLLGHSDVRLTMDIYTHVDDDQLRTAINKLPSFGDLESEKPRKVGNE